MKTQLKSIAVVMSIMFATVVCAVAQEYHPVSKALVRGSGLYMLEKNLHRSDAPGIVEGALYDAVEAKNAYPDLDYSKLSKAIDRLGKESSDPAISYKAYLVSMYLSHSSEIQVTPISGAEYHEYLFKQIADQLEAKFLAFQNY